MGADFKKYKHNLSKNIKITIFGVRTELRFSDGVKHKSSLLIGHLKYSKIFGSNFTKPLASDFYK